MANAYRSHAKLNLHLQVVGRRSDGYHELRTIFQTIELHDVLYLECTSESGVELTVSEGDAPAGSQNLAARAASAFLERWAPDRGVRIELEKRIPAASGLGGGSSNAATVLRALQDELGQPAPPGELWKLARELGADVPFFLVGGTALGVGRGDEIVPLEDIEPAPVWLFFPAAAISTRRVFAELASVMPEPLAPQIASALVEGRSHGLRDLLGFNDLEPVVLAGYPAVRAVYNSVLAVGLEPVRLSGSGATLFSPDEGCAAVGESQTILPEGTSMSASRTLTRSQFGDYRST